jgi:periplasmic protein TonB
MQCARSKSIWGPYETCVISERESYGYAAGWSTTNPGTGTVYLTRTVEAVRSEIAVAAPPPPPAPKPEVATKVFDVVEEMPSFPGGQGALMQYLASNIKYPVVAQENGVQGRVIVSFVVERDGSISDVKVARSVDPSLDREAQRVVKSMPRWSPGKQNGSTVRVKYTVPVVFRLQ